MHRALTLGLMCTFILGASPLQAHVVVPDLRNLTQEEASQLAAEVNITLVPDQRSSRSRIGTIFDQIPAAGSTVEDGGRVAVMISAGIVVPNVVGLPSSEALQALEDHGVSAEVTVQPGGNVARGSISGTIPSTGETIDASFQVVFLVERSSTQSVIPSDLVGLTASEASKRLSALGLTAEFSQPLDYYVFGHICTPSYRYEFDVTSVLPVAGSVVSVGSSILVGVQSRLLSSTPGGPCTEEGVPL